MKELLRKIPKVDELLRSACLAVAIDSYGDHAVTEAVRTELDTLRQGILQQQVTVIPEQDILCSRIAKRAQRTSLPSFRHVINGTGIVLHTKDYALYYGDPLDGVDMEQGLTLGNLMASTRARIGRYGTPQDCADSLALPLSQRGMTFAEDFVALAAENEGQVLVAVPSRYIEHPRYTIGLGDTFTAGVQISFRSARQ